VAAARQAFLTRTVRLDVAPGGFVVFVEYAARGAAGGRGEAAGAEEGPPAWMRLERSTLVAEAAAAGLQLEDAPPVLGPSMYVLVMRKPEA
jgi:hypothetical protein